MGLKNMFGSLRRGLEIAQCGGLRVGNENMHVEIVDSGQTSYGGQACPFVTAFVSEHGKIIQLAITTCKLQCNTRVLYHMIRWCVV